MNSFQKFFPGRSVCKSCFICIHLSYMFDGHFPHFPECLLTAPSESQCDPVGIPVGYTWRSDNDTKATEYLEAAVHCGPLRSPSLQLSLLNDPTKLSGRYYCQPGNRKHSSNWFSCSSETQTAARMKEVFYYMTEHEWWSLPLQRVRQVRRVAGPTLSSDPVWDVQQELEQIFHYQMDQR